MKKSNFLDRLRRERKLELIEASEEIKESYLIKANNCFKSAKILYQNRLYENSVSEAYYAMYNCLLALLHKTGIKAENHSASIILLKEFFKERDLAKSISFAKEERIDKQYYVESEQKQEMIRKSCSDMVSKAEDFIINMRIVIDKINNEDMSRIRANFQQRFGRNK